MINKVNFSDIICHLHRYAEGGYISYNDVSLATSAVIKREANEKEQKWVFKVLTDLGIIGESVIDPSDGSIPTRFKLNETIE